MAEKDPPSGRVDGFKTGSRGNHNKKLIALALALVMVLSLAACGERIVVDGVEYLKADFPDNAGFCVATYFENGEKQVFTLGVDE